MPFERPPLDVLRSQAAADVAGAVPGSNPLLPVSNLGILADLLAEGVNATYGYLDWIARQAVPFTATDEAFEGWAALKGVTRKPATAAAGTGTWPATPGVLLPAGTPISRADGQTYVTTEDATAGGGGSVTAALQATVPGAAGTLTNGDQLLLAQAIPGIASTGSATSAAPGADVEAFEAFRTRTLAVYAAPPQGGAKSDYPEWALQVAGVTRAWCTPNGEGPGTVIVYFMMDQVRSAENGFPQGSDGVAAADPRDIAAAGDQLVVANWIFDLQPVTALVYLVAPQPNTVAFTISLPGASPGLKSAIAAAIDAVFLAAGAPGGTVNLSQIETAIGAIAGTAGFVITSESCDHGAITPATGNIQSSAGYLPVRGLLTWA